MLPKALLFALVLAALLASGGCRRRPPAEAPAEASADAGRAMLDLQARVDQQVARGATPEAVRLLEEALPKAEFAAHRPEILRRALGYRLGGGDLEGAQRLYLAVVERDAASAMRAFGLIESHLQRSGASAELAAWCENLLAMDALQPLGAQLHGMLIESARMAGDPAALRAAYERGMTELPEAEAVRAVEGSFGAMLQADQAGLLHAALDFVEERQGANPAYADAIAIARVRLAVKESRLDEAADLAASAAGRIGADGQALVLDLVARAAETAARADLIERLCGGAVDTQPPASRVFAVAARHWAQASVSAGDLDRARDKVAALLERGAPASLLLDVTQTFIYEALDRGTPEARRRWLELCEGMRSVSERTEDRTRSSMLMLDASFITEEFDRALSILGDGVPARDEDWHRMLTGKVKAHKAVKEGRFEDAVGHFREFMAQLVQSREELMNPSTGTRVPLDAVLGLNAVRIGGLWQSAGRLEEAAAAYDEARTHYRAALESLEPGTDAYTATQRELEAVPALSEAPEG